MVWALILSFFLLMPSPALAEPLEVDSVEDSSQPVEYPDSVPSADSLPDVPALTDTATSPPHRASANSIYGSVQPNSAYIAFFARCLPILGWTDDYVLYRSGQYEYRFAYGDLSFDGGVFRGSNINFVVLKVSSTYNNDVLIDFDSGSLSLNPSNFIVFSNLGGYPAIDLDYSISSIALFGLVVAFVCYLLRSIWDFLLRMGVTAIVERS